MAKKSQIVTKLKNSNYDKTKKNQIMKKIKSNCDETQKLNVWENLKNHVVIKPKL